MASCDVVPTLTTAQVITSQSLVTTSTESISTAPGSVSTVVVSTCAQVESFSPCIPTVTTSFITSPGSTTTITVPATLTVNVPVTVSTILFGSSCSSSSSVSTAPSITTPTPTPTSTPTSTPTATSTDSTPTPTSSSASFSASLTSTSTDTSSSTATLIPVVTTPPPTVITTNSLVTSDGSTFLSSFTTTSTQAATTVLALSTGTPSDKKVATGPVVGGVLGGLAALLLLGLLTWRLVKKQSKFDRFFNRDKGHDEYRHGPHHRGSVLKKPSYQYGMVGQPTSIPVSLGPQPTLPTVQNAFGNSSGIGQAQGPPQSTAGQVGGQVGGQTSGQVSGQTSGQFGGQTSGQVSGQTSGPLGNNGGFGQASGPSGALGSGGGLGHPVAGTSHGVISNMPPIAHTGDPSLIPLITGIGTTAAASGLLAAATSSRPSSSRPSTGSSQVLGPLVTPAKPRGGYLPTAQSWNTSHGYGQAQAGPSTLPNNATKLSISSVASTSSAYSHTTGIGDSSTNRTMGENSGSVPPILPSMEGSSRLQQYQQHLRRTTSASRQVTTNADYHPYAEVGTSSMGAADSSQEAPLYDESGRPLNMPPEKAPLVHLDGALYQESPGDDPSPEYIA